MGFSLGKNDDEFNGPNKPSRKKPIFPVNDLLRNYLKHQEEKLNSHFCM
jgi:hypothetical protein